MIQLFGVRKCIIRALSQPVESLRFRSRSEPVALFGVRSQTWGIRFETDLPAQASQETPSSWFYEAYVLQRGAPDSGKAPGQKSKGPLGLGMLLGSRIASLRAPSEFQRVISEGRRFSGRYVLAFTVASDKEHLRLGVSSSSRAGSKVKRNRLKRLLREAARRASGLLSSGLDLVLIAKAGATGHSLKDITDDLEEVFTRVETHYAGRGAVDNGGVKDTC